MPYLKNDSGESAEVRNQQVLGDDSPLEFDEDGYAYVEDSAVADKLLAMHRHIERGGKGPAGSASTETDDDAEGDSTHEFDAEAFVDRTPMSDVVADLESGGYDDHLDAIKAAEEAGRDRDGVATAIENRRE
jgi:hypothetical protein